MRLFVESIEFAPPPANVNAPETDLETCDAFGVMIWLRRHGYVWCLRSEGAAGDRLAVRGPFDTLADAAADAVAALGLPQVH